MMGTVSQRWTAVLTIAILQGCSGGSDATSPTGQTPTGQTPAPSGQIRVRIVTVGSRIDADGYVITLNDGQPRAVQPNDSATFANLPLDRSYNIRVTAVAANCDDELGSPLVYDAEKLNASIDVTFRIVCGRLVTVDTTHLNSEAAIDSRQTAFATILRSLGYVVRPPASRDLTVVLPASDVFVIVNPMAPENIFNDTLPTYPAFTTVETTAIRDWVNAGGSLLLIADHMPAAGSAARVAAAFDIGFANGFAWDTAVVPLPRQCLFQHEVQVFRRSDGTLGDHPVTAGRNAAERVDSVVTFNGQAFEISSATAPLLTFGPGAIQAFPHRQWVFTPATPRQSAVGWRQGAARSFGNGRVAAFADAAMFSERTCGPDNRPQGMTHASATQNRQLLLNVIRWLTREL